MCQRYLLNIWDTYIKGIYSASEPSEQFDEIFIWAATALYHEQLQGEASVHAMLDKEDERFGHVLRISVFLSLYTVMA